jgi:agmatinase
LHPGTRCGDIVTSMMHPFDPDAAALAESGIYGLPHTVEDARVVVVPAPFAATTSYGGGAEQGPRAVLEASRQVDLFDLDTGRPYEHGIVMLPESDDVRTWDREARALAEQIIACGGRLDGDPTLHAALARVNALSARLNDYVYDTTRAQLDCGKLVALVGGDHAVPFGCIRAHAERYPGLGVLHLDAHADLRTAYEGFTWSHASIMANVLDRIDGVAKLVQVGIRDFSNEEHARITSSKGRVVSFFDAQMAARRFEGVGWATIVREIVEALPHHVYLSFDIDGLDPTLCPHTGTPVPGGLTFQEAAYMVGAVERSGRHIVGLDLVEVVPGPDGDEWDGNVAARLLYKMIGHMLRTAS